MGWFGNKDAIEAHRTARQDLEEYGDHQRERGDHYETDEYLRLNQRVIDAEANVPWWRR